MLSAGFTVVSVRSWGAQQPELTLFTSFSFSLGGGGGRVVTLQEPTTIK